MNARIEFQTLMGPDGKPAFVMVPYNEFRRMYGGFTPGTVPHVVVSAVVDGGNKIKAWREYLRLTQAEVAGRIGVTKRHLHRWKRRGGRVKRRLKSWLRRSV